MQLLLELDQNNGAALVSRKPASFSAVLIYDQVVQNIDISYHLSDILLNSFLQVHTLGANYVTSSQLVC